MKQEFKFEALQLSFNTINQQDTELLVSWRSLPDNTQYFKTHSKITIASQLQWFSEVYLKTLQRYDFIISYKCDCAKIGTVTLKDIDYNLHCAEIGYAIYETSYRGKGFAKQAVQAIVDFGANELGINSFIICAHKDNVASNKVAVSCGFLYESTKDYFNYYRLEYKLK